MLAASVAAAASRQRPSLGTLWLAAVAATAVVVAASAGGLWLWGQGYLPRTYQTGVGQTASVVLPDGSMAYLNTDTRLRWVGSPGNRRVRLLRGEAFFEVVHEPTRPFRILLAHSEVRVLGTRFDVLGDAETVTYRGKELKGAPKTVAQLEVTRVEPDLCHAKILRSDRPVQVDDKVQERAEEAQTP